jgi:hypothetical protein
LVTLRADGSRSCVVQSVRHVWRADRLCVATCLAALGSLVGRTWRGAAADVSRCEVAGGCLSWTPQECASVISSGIDLPGDKFDFVL